MEQAVYCFEHVDFSPAGHRGVAGLNLPSLIFLCQLYTPNFPETSGRRWTRRELLNLLYDRVRLIFFLPSPLSLLCTATTTSQSHVVQRTKQDESMGQTN